MSAESSPVLMFDRRLGDSINGIDINYKRLGLALDDLKIPDEERPDIAVRFYPVSPLSPSIGTHLVRQPKLKLPLVSEWVLDRHGLTKDLREFPRIISVGVGPIAMGTMRRDLLKRHEGIDAAAVDAMDLSDYQSLIMGHELHHVQNPIVRERSQRSFRQAYKEVNGWRGFPREASGFLQLLSLVQLYYDATGNRTFVPGQPYVPLSTLAVTSIYNRRHKRKEYYCNEEEISARQYISDCFARGEDNPWHGVVRLWPKEEKWFGRQPTVKNALAEEQQS